MMRKILVGLVVWIGRLVVMIELCVASSCRGDYVVVINDTLVDDLLLYHFSCRTLVVSSRSTIPTILLFRISVVAVVIGDISSIRRVVVVVISIYEIVVVVAVVVILIRSIIVL